jgi:threonine synthase
VVFSEKLSNKLDIELYFKDEMYLPSGTWKDREGFVSIHRLLKSNVNDLFVFSSGNTGTSLARSASIIRGPRLHMVIPAASKKRVESCKEFFDEEYVKVYFFEGSNDECIVEAKRLADKFGYRVEGGFANYARREGLKLLALEVILTWKERVDWYVQAVAGGLGIYSYHKACRDLGIEESCPKMLGVQPDICAPMVRAWRAGAAYLEEEYVPQKVIPSEFVRVLRTRRPDDSYPVLKKIMDKVEGRFEDVSDSEILEALRLFYYDPYYVGVLEERNQFVGLEPATAMAGVVKGVQNGYIKKGERVLLNVSGAAKNGDLRMEWISDLI